MKKIIVIILLLILTFQIVSSKQISYNEQYDFLIISPDEFKINFTPLKQHKETKEKLKEEKEGRILTFFP